jgi:hypothetical protein
MPPQYTASSSTLHLGNFTNVNGTTFDFTSAKVLIGHDPVADNEIAAKGYVDNKIAEVCLVQQNRLNAIMNATDVSGAYDSLAEIATLAQSLQTAELNQLNTDISALQGLLTAEVDARLAGDAANQTLINSHFSTLGSSLDGYSTTLTGLISTEANARINGDATLQTLINNERDARVAAISALSSTVTSNYTHFVGAGSDTGAFGALTTTISGIISQEAIDRTTAISAAVGALELAKNSMAGNLTATSNALNAAIGAESGARATAVSSMQSDIASNLTYLEGKISMARTALDTSVSTVSGSIQGALSGTLASINAQRDRITSLIGDAGIDAVYGDNLATLSGLQAYVEALQNAENTTIDQQIINLGTSLSTYQTNLNASLSAETASRLQGDAGLRTELATETSVRQAADASIAAAVAAEIAARTLSEGVISQNIVNEQSARANAVATLAALISNETSARSGRFTTLGALIDAEASTRGNYITGIQAIETGMVTNISALESQVEQLYQTFFSVGRTSTIDLAPSSA